MAKQPFESSEFPYGERQLAIAKSHVEKVIDKYITHLPDHVGTQLQTLHTQIQDAFEAKTVEERTENINDAQETVQKLQRDNAFNFTLSSGLEHMVLNRFDRAETELNDYCREEF